MNKWEKEVQQSLLDSEETAIKELEKSYKVALRDINDKVRLFDADIKMLDTALEQATEDEKSQLLSMRQSKVYQKQYQEALKGQVNGILDKMYGDEYKTIEKYLKDSYTDAYVGTMYSIAKQGIPIITPINQTLAVKSILTNSKISKGLYTRLGVDATKLKKSITHEISRGIASGLSTVDIARNISNVSNAPLSRAKTIARTESHRIKSEASFQAAHEAKAKGADILKQWDATLDGRTRPTHRKVDGEIKELEEKFSNGMMYPGDSSGGAAEVVNCRCVANTRARWALDESELDELKERAEYFGLDKADNFTDFEEKYLKAAEKTNEGVATSWVKTGNLPPSKNDFDSYEEYKKAMTTYKGNQRYWDNSEWENHHVYDETEMMNAKRFDATITQIHEKYPLLDDSTLIIGDYDLVQHNLTAIQRKRIHEDARAQAWQNPDTGKSIIGYRPNYGTATFTDDLIKRETAISKGEVLDEVFAGSAEGTAIHEYGHLVSAYIDRGYTNDNPIALEYWEWYKTLDHDDIAKGLSKYATTNKWEFEAEAFAELQTNNPRPIAQKFGEYIDKLMGVSYNGSGSEDDTVETLAKKLNTSAKQTVILPKNEYAHVMSEVATHITERQKGQAVFSKAIGNNIYVFENNGFGNYRVIDKIKIEDDVNDRWSE